MKCANAPSIKTIRNRFPNSKFSSNHGTKYNMRKEIINRNGSKILQDSDILLKPLNIIDIFTDVLHSAFKLCVENAIFRSILKATDVNPVFKKTVELAKTITIIDLLVRLQRF